MFFQTTPRIEGKRFSIVKNIESFYSRGFSISRSKVFLLVAIAMMVIEASAPIYAQTVRTVGSGGTYTTLKLAFDAINAGSITGNIELQIVGNSTETATATLNASGTGSANYSAISIYPTGTRTISGNLALPIINLNDADNVTIDGRIGRTGTTKSLTLSNLNTGGSVIQFINDASSNTIKYCVVQGVNTTLTSGLIVFSTGNITGNDNNTIDNCDVSAGASTPSNAIYSAGTSVAVDNSGNTISNNNILDYFNAIAASNGIYVASNSSAWTIIGNKFYQTTTRTVTTAATIHAINIATTSGGNYSVTNNIIGHSTNTGTGTTTYAGTVASLYRAIELNVGTNIASSVQGNTISGFSFTTSGGLTTAPGIFTGISVLGGTVNIGTVTGNTIGATTGMGDITVTSSTTLDYLAGIYATSSATVSIQNNTIGAITNGTSTTIGYNFYGINTAGGGNFTISGNTIGSTSTANSIGVGTGTTTTGVCTFNGIGNSASGVISITGNTIQNCTAYGTGASIYNGILNSAGVGTLNINTNNMIAGTNYGTGTLTGISNTAIVATLNMNDNVVRSLSKPVATGAVTALSNGGAVTTAININNNHLGNATGGLVTFTVANSGALTGISNTGGAATAALAIQGNDIQGITHSVAGSSVHSYITNTANTLTQDISSNTFTNLTVNTTGSVTFITVSNGLFAAGTQNVSSNSIVTAFNKTGAGGTVIFCNATGTSQPGSVITQNLNNFSNVTVTSTTAITGWINSNSSLNKTFSTNTFNNWTGSATALTVMSITTGASTITGNTISNISTGTAAVAPIVAISSGATGAIAITDNNISSLVTGSAAFANSFTGITNNAGTDVTITGNTITGCTAGGTGLSLFTGITTITAGSGTLTITGNNIISGTNYGVGASATFTAISNGAPFATANISNNIIRSNNVTASATGVFTAISNSGIVTTVLNINNNQLGNATGGLVTYSAANTSTLTGISNTGGAVSCALTIQGNDLRGITHSVAGSSAHNYIINSAATLSQNISSNTFTNLSVNTTGAITFITDNVAMPANGVQNVNSNSIVTAFVRTAASGAITLFTSTTATNNSNVTVTNNSNNFSNITVTGATTITGWVNTDAGLGNVTKTIDGNTFSNWTAGTGTGAITALTVNITSTNNATRNNIINTLSSAGTIYGITTGAGNDNIYSNTINTLISTGGTTTVVNGIAITAGTLKNVYQNTIYNLQANGITTGSASGIAITGGTTNAVYSNKTYAISSTSSGITTTGSVNGILVSGATTDQINTLYNNKIGDIRATTASVATPVCGISITNSGVRTATNVYYNTIYLNATSSGTNFGSSGIYHTAYSTATTATLDLRNNVIVNLSTPNGTGTTVAFRRSSGAAGMLANYASTSNNNLFYSGYSSVTTHLIYSDGTGSAQTLATYKAGVFTAGTIAPRDQASITENPAFASTTGSSTDYLKNSPTAVTYMESGAANIAGITTDFDGDIRSGNPGYPAQTNGFGTSPDIGADEFDGAKPNIVVLNSNEASDGYYATLGAAFVAINAQNQTGKSIAVTLLRSTNETTTATLTGGAWTSLNVYPTTTSLSISGNLAAPLVDLNNADNVTFDGRVNQTGSTASLSIDNSSTSATAGTSTIRFIQSAENNTVKYCYVKGSSMSTTDGVILFSTASAGNGNDNNLINNCFLTNSGGNRPINMIYSAGTSGFENNPNTISNNSIYNFLNASASSNGILIGANSTDWVVSTNSFYETTSFVPTSGTFDYSAIRIDNTSGNNFTVTGNNIGGQATLCGGSAWSVNAATNHSFHAISLKAGTTTASNIQNNVIRNWSYRSASTTPWQGIQILGGTVNIGTTTANVIGSNTGTGSITLTATTDGESCGIYVANSGTVTVSNNQIGSITVVGNSSNVSHSFYAIHKTAVAGSLIASNNIIGSTGTSNSINASSTATTSVTPQHLCAIFSESSSSANITLNTVSNLNNAYGGTLNSNTNGIRMTAGLFFVTNNTINNLNSASLGTNGSVIGIAVTGSDAMKMVNENVIYALSNSGSTFSGYVAGIDFSANTGGSPLNANFIRTLTVNATSTGASVYGIRIASGLNTLSNNIISLGGTTATTLYGIYETGAVSNDNALYFNTVYLNGSLGSGITNKSYALYSNASTNNRDFRNNIFSNFRSTTGGSNLHYAAYLNYSTNTNLTLDHNDYYAPGTGGVIGYYNGSNKTTLPIVATQDANSFNVNPSFSSAGGLIAVNYKVTAALNGEIGLIDVPLDYEMVARGTPPNIGAFEFYTNRWTGAVSTDYGDALNWSSSSIPVSGAPLVFDDSPMNDCYLDNDRTIGNITNTQSAYKFVVNGKQLTINGGLYFYNAAQMDAKTASSTLVFAGSAAQSIPENALVDNTVENLTVNNTHGLTSDGNLTVENVLNLLSANPSDSKGSLDIGSSRMLTLGSLSSITGNGDVTGIVRRNDIAASTEYAFSNKNTKVTFGATGTLPTDVQIKLTLGAAPSWKPTAVKRIYEFSQTDGADCLADVTVGYLQSEMNGNDETKLVFWNAVDVHSPTATEWGYSTLETTNNWISISSMPINLWATALGQNEIALAATSYPTLLWNGSYSTSWIDANNWTPNSFPTKYTTTTIPNAATTTFNPTVPLSADINNMGIQSGGILNAGSGTQLNIFATNMNGWNNTSGTFNPDNSTVVFKNTGVTISGTTTFNNVSILSGSVLTPLTNSVMGIAGTLSNAGTLNATAFSNTIDYNGGNQTVITPNGTIAGYFNLTLSGSNAKTLPTSTLNVEGDLTLSGTAIVAPTNPLTIKGNLVVGSGTTFTAGNLTHQVGGDVMNNGGTFTLTGSTIALNSTSEQTIGGTASSTFNHLTINNASGVTLANDETFGGVLTLTNGMVNTDIYTLTQTSTGSISGASASNHINGKLAEVFAGTGTKLFPIGKDGNYRPLTIQLNALTGTTTLAAEQFENTLPGTLPANTDLFGDRYWQITQTGGSGHSYLLTLDGTGWSRVGTPKILKGNGSTNTSYATSGTAYTNSTAFTSFGYFGLAETDIMWNGSVNNNWFNASNWSSGMVPTGTYNIVIPSSLSTYPSISGTSPAQDVDISNGTALTLDNGATLTLEAGPVLTFESGATVTTGTSSKVLVKSGASYLNMSTSGPTLEMQRALTGTKGWRMVASPVASTYSDMFKSPLVTQGFTGSTFPTLQPNLLWWLESDGGTTLQSWRKPTNLTDNLTSGQGYFHYLFNGAGRLNANGTPSGSNYTDVLPTTMSVTGVDPFNGTGTYDYNLTYTTKASTQTPSPTDTIYYDLNSLDQGWNFIGNPTASTLDWDATGWTKTSLDNTIYIWDPSALSGNGDYLTWNGTTGTLGNGRIAPFQAFWVHATDDNTLSFTNAVKSRTAGTFLRSSSTAETITLPLTLSYGKLQTTSFITFSQNGVTGPDRWDAYRLEPMSDTWLSLYTLSSPSTVSPLVINNLPMPEEDMIDIPLYCNSQINDGTKGDYLLQWTLPENWPSSWKISLQDHRSELIYSMTDHTRYAFNTTSGDTISAMLNTLPLPKKMVNCLTNNSLLRSTASLPPFSIVISKGSDIEYIAPKAQLVGNYPNPFNVQTTVRFSLPAKAKVRVEVLSLQGVRIATLADGTYSAGITEVKWNAKGNAPGLYFIKFISGETVETKKALIIN